MQEVGIFNLEISVARNGLEKYMSFTINNKLILVLHKQKWLYSYEYLTNFEKFTEGLPTKKPCITRQLIEKPLTKNINVWKKVEMKTIKNYPDLYLKYDVLLLADAFEKFRNNSLNDYGLCSIRV